MKAPDKIYVSIPTRLQSDSPKYVGIAWNDKSNLTTPQIEEYIRKDALLKWLEEKLKERHAPQFRDALGQVIDKINSL